MKNILARFMKFPGDSRPVWLFGENLGATANNNSFYMWRHVVNRHSADVAPYLILEKTASNRKTVADMIPHERRYVVWRHSPAHAWLYLKAEFSFVTLSFHDVLPECVKLWGFTKSFHPRQRCSLVYLQHGTLGIKALGYGPTYANETMLRFIHYNPHIAEKLVSVNKFRQYQLFYGIYHPRYQEMLRRAEAAPAYSGRRILWFLTWREYMGKNIFTYKFFAKIRKVLEMKELRDWLEAADGVLTICLHHLCSTKCAQYLDDVRAACTPRMKIVFASQIDVMDEISNADILATDYSSLGFDFTFLRKPVLLYAQDLDIYRRERKFYCTQKEFENAAIQDPREFVKRLTSGDYPALNPFFAERMRIPDDETYAKVKDGYYIERMYEHFRKLQNETYAFLGYDFSGVGGTVFATKALAEGLLEAGKRVLLCPLKNGGTGSYPPGTVNRPMIDYTHLSIAVRLMCRLFNRKKHYSYLQYDKDMPNLRPYCGWALTRLMKNIHAKAVISTRETMHFFLDDATSPWIKEKFYYFHCNAGLLEGIFPGTIERLKRRCLDTALFVTERNKRALAELFGYRHYKRGVVTGNALNSSRMIDRRSVTAVTEKPRGFIVATLLRLGEERRADIERAVDFARYLKTKGQTRIRINVFGKGELVKWLQYLLVDEELDAIMAYRGETRDIVKTYKAHDAMVDFSRLQSFGMGYIEAVFNGRIPFCMHNEGSDEVLEGIPRCFYETNEELEAKILALPGVTIGELRGNYERLARRYSRAAVANHLVSVDRKTHRKIVFEFLDRIEDGARIVIFDSAPDSSPALIGSAGEIRLERRNDGLLQADIHPETDNWWIGVTPHARIETGRFFPCGRIYKNASFRIGRYVMFWDCDRLAFRKMSPVRQLWRRGLFWIELLCDRRTGARKAALARLAVVVLRLFKHRPLWLIADRLDAAGDNGEALFLHLRKNHPSLDVRFIVSSRTSTFRSLGTKGPVVASESPKRKILTLLSDCLISSQAERAFSNPFDGYSEPYRDLLAKIPIVFLQHGATKDDVSSKLGRRTRNFAGFVVSAVQERNSVVNGAYGYDTKQVWLTGLPRFDLLRPSPDAEKHILIMPTWRLSLMDGQTGPNHEWRLKNGFRKSGFFKFYDGLLSDKKLLNTCRRRGYAISFVLHPNMLQAKLFFRPKNDVVTIPDEDVPYGDLFSRGALLVTDYSSTAFDFAYLRKPVIYAQFDADSFFAGGHTYRKGYFDYERDGFGEVEYSLDATVARIIAYIKTGCAAKKEYLERVDNFFAFRDGENCRRVAEHIFRLAGSAKPPPARICR